MPEIIIITINYRNTDLTEKLVSSIEKCREYRKIQLVLVDNDSTAQSLKDLHKIKEDSSVNISIIDSKVNRYYWGGAIYAFEKIQFDEESKPDWVLVCNNDIIFDDNMIFSNLLTFETSKFPVIAPKIISQKTGQNQNPHLKNPLSIFFRIYYKLYYFSYFTAGIVHFFGSLFRTIGNSFGAAKGNIFKEKIYAPHGSCIIFSKKYFNSGGYLDDNFKMYGEELSTAEIAKKLGLSVKYCSNLSVSHIDHASTSASSRRKNFYYSKETYKYISRAYFNNK